MILFPILFAKRTFLGFAVEEISWHKGVLLLGVRGKEGGGVEVLGVRLLERGGMTSVLQRYSSDEINRGSW